MQRHEILDDTQKDLKNTKTFNKSSNTYQCNIQIVKIKYVRRHILIKKCISINKMVLIGPIGTLYCPAYSPVVPDRAPQALEVGVATKDQQL